MKKYNFDTDEVLARNFSEAEEYLSITNKSKLGWESSKEVNF